MIIVFTVKLDCFYEGEDSMELEYNIVAKNALSAFERGGKLVPKSDDFAGTTKELEAVVPMECFKVVTTDEPDPEE